MVLRGYNSEKNGAFFLIARNLVSSKQNKFNQSQTVTHIIEAQAMGYGRAEEIDSFQLG